MNWEKNHTTMTIAKIKQLIIDYNQNEIGAHIRAELDNGTDPFKILKILTEGMDEVGKLYEEQEYFLPELVLAGETMKIAFNILQPFLKADGKVGKDTIICATVKGDIHDIGKFVLSSILMSYGFNVLDLGVDVPTSVIIDTVKKNDARVIALSTLLTMTIREITNVHNALEAEGLRERVRIIAGGAPLNMELAKRLGADDYAPDAIEGVKHIKNLLEIK